jgi:hypothetical protein
MSPSRPLLTRVADLLWLCYPPVAILAIAALLLASGCSRSTPVEGVSAIEASQGTLASARVGPAYPDGLPVIGTAAARATIRHGRNQVDVINLGPTPWHEGRLWLNERYSIDLPRTEPGEIRRLPFSIFRDATGRTFPLDNRIELVEGVELQMGDELTRVSWGLDY